MKFRFFSDLHVEKDLINIKRPHIDHVWSPTALPGDQDTVLILAGDIWNGTRPILFAKESWIQRLSNRFKEVVIVFGNHDYWGDNVDTLTHEWREMLVQKMLGNVHVLELADGVENGRLAVDGVTMLGSTMWTDMDRSNPLVRTKFDFEKGYGGEALWNDQNFIRAGQYHRFTASHWLRKHFESVKNFKRAMQAHEHSTRSHESVLLVLHHAPCLLSTQRRESDPLSRFLFGSDLSDLILDHPSIKQVIHGHTHEVFDYAMGDVRIRCNPRGYAPGSLVETFDPVALNELF